ncbi:hypothetical protein ABC855_g1607 [[Candida] zeylanoides]
MLKKANLASIAHSKHAIKRLSTLTSHKITVDVQKSPALPCSPLQRTELTWSSTNSPTCLRAGGVLSPTELAEDKCISHLEQALSKSKLSWVTESRIPTSSIPKEVKCTMPVGAKSEVKNETEKPKEKKSKKAKKKSEKASRRAAKAQEAAAKTKKATVKAEGKTAKIRAAAAKPDGDPSAPPATNELGTISTGRKVRPTKDALAYLVEKYKESPYLTAEVRAAISEHLGMSEIRVGNWFRHKRLGDRQRGKGAGKETPLDTNSWDLEGQLKFNAKLKPTA